MNYVEEVQDTTKQGIPSQDSDNSYNLFTLLSNSVCSYYYIYICQYKYCTVLIIYIS